MQFASTSTALLPGDVALVVGASMASKAIVLAQRFARTRANFSHCAIYIRGDLWCHAIPMGVEIITTHDLLSGSAYLPNWRILRNPRVAVSNNASNLGDRWLDSILFFAGQKYNFRIDQAKKDIDADSFCSELVAKSHHRMGFQFLAADSATILPADIEIMADEQGWPDATAAVKLALLNQAPVDEIRRVEQAFKITFLHFRRKSLESRLEGARCGHFVTRQSLASWRPADEQLDQSDRERCRLVALAQAHEAKSIARELLALYWDSGPHVDRQLAKLASQMDESEFSEDELTKLLAEDPRWWI